MGPCYGCSTLLVADLHISNSASSHMEDSAPVAKATNEQLPLSLLLNILLCKIDTTMNSNNRELCKICIVSTTMPHDHASWLDWSKVIS